MSQLKKVFMAVIKFLGRLWSKAAKIIGSFFLFSFLLMILAVIASGKTEPRTSSKTIRSGSEDKIAVVELNGQIVQAANERDLFSFDPFLITPTRVRNLLNEIRQDKLIKAVIIDLNSPGGSVVASDEIYRLFKDFNTSIPVVFRFREVGASGGYYVALAGEKIVANQATLTGSIGVIAYSPNLTNLYDKLGVKINAYKSGEYKDMGSPNRAATESEGEIFQSIINDSYQMFVDVIVRERNLTKDRVLELADGRIYSGLQAKENGLIDQIGDMEATINLTAEQAGIEDPTVIIYSQGSWVQSILGSTVNKLGPSYLTNQIDRIYPESGLYFLWVN